MWTFPTFNVFIENLAVQLIKRNGNEFNGYNVGVSFEDEHSFYSFTRFTKSLSPQPLFAKKKFDNFSNSVEIKITNIVSKYWYLQSEKTFESIDLSIFGCFVLDFFYVLINLLLKFQCKCWWNKSSSFCANWLLK